MNTLFSLCLVSLFARDYFTLVRAFSSNNPGCLFCTTSLDGRWRHNKIRNNLDIFSGKNHEYKKPRVTAVSLFSTNPNDNETPEERSARMELVRKLQKTYYQSDDSAVNNAQTSNGFVNAAADKSGQFKDPYNPNILHNLPLWRVQWTELPGFQNILNVHVPHYTHMFRTIFGQKSSPPWYFGHIYLEDGSVNLDNTNFALDPDPETGESRTKAVLTGTLMQVVDYAENEDDGRLTLVVQGLEKFKVISPLAVPAPPNNCTSTSEEQVYDDASNMDECDLFEIEKVELGKHPYATATVELIPDQELIERHYFGNKGSNELSKPTLWNEAHVLAMTEAFHWHKFEYRPVQVENCLIGGGISPLANFDALKVSSLEKSSSDVMKLSLESFQKNSKEVEVINGGSLLQNNVSHQPSKLVNLDIRNAAVPDMEYQVWVELDRMVRLLVQANPYENVSVPVPAQILNLLPLAPPPNRMDVKSWPGFFNLHKYAETLSKNENALIGTATKSPFVQIDSLNLSLYPDLRRARLFSFVVWFLLHQFMHTLGDDDEELTMQRVLEIDSIYERLRAAKNKLGTINDRLRSMIQR